MSVLFNNYKSEYGMDIISPIIEYILPKYCLVCNWPSDVICSKCAKRLSPTLPHCYMCLRINSSYKTHEKCLSTKGSVFNSIYAAWKYNRFSRRILKMSEERYLGKVVEKLSLSVADSIERSGFLHNIENAVIIPFSTSKKDLGFNLVRIISEDISRRFGLRMDSTITDLEKKPNKYRKTTFILVTDVIKSHKQINKAGSRILKRHPEENKLIAISLFRRYESILFNKVRDMNPV